MFFASFRIKNKKNKLYYVLIKCLRSLIEVKLEPIPHSMSEN